MANDLTKEPPPVCDGVWLLVAEGDEPYGADLIALPGFAPLSWEPQSGNVFKFDGTRYWVLDADPNAEGAG